jgi:hypothetical protein
MAKGVTTVELVASGFRKAFAGVMQIARGGVKASVRWLYWLAVQLCCFGLPEGPNLFQHDYALCCVRMRKTAAKRLIQWNLMFGPSGALFWLHP